MNDPTSNNDKRESQPDLQPDFIASSGNIKTLFTLPYSSNESLSQVASDPAGSLNIAIHNMNGTLILADGSFLEQNVTGLDEYARPSSGSSDGDCTTTVSSGSPVRSQPALLNNDDDSQLMITNKNDNTLAKLVQGLMISSESQNINTNDGLNNMDDEEQIRQYIAWKFHDMKLLIGSDALICTAPKTNSYDDDDINNGESSSNDDMMTVRLTELQEFEAQVNQHKKFANDGQFIPDSTSFTNHKKTKSYAQIVTLERESRDRENIAPGSFNPPQFNDISLQNTAMPPNIMNGLITSKKRANLESTTSPVWTCIDAYLDNIMANVPQLALCLKDKGFIHSVNFLRTEDIPTSMFSIDCGSSSPIGPLFDPSDIDINASVLLRFLKQNCSKDNSTYLLRREDGESNIRLYDVSTISQQRQRKWTWWLAQMSYRFARKLMIYSNSSIDPHIRRIFRTRQRSLLETSLELLEELSDMGGASHDIMRASVRGDLADTYLRDDKDGDGNISILPVYSQLYVNVKQDPLTKAQDLLAVATKSLEKVVEEEAKQSIIAIDAYRSQLYNIQMKRFDVSMRLSEAHLKSYWSSSVMQTIRNSARILSATIRLLRDSCSLYKDPFLSRIRSRYSWLWETCGKFARSFAGDSLWRERGHSCGDDVISLLREVEKELKYSDSDVLFGTPEIESLASGLVTLENLNILVNSASTDLHIVSRYLNEEKQLLKDKRRTIVAAIICYSNVVGVFDKMGISLMRSKTSKGLSSKASIVKVDRCTPTYSEPCSHTTYQRLGDACNEAGAVLLTSSRHVLAQDRERISTSPIIIPSLLNSAKTWFMEGLGYFQLCDDVCNVALVHANLAQCCKLFAPPAIDSKTLVNDIENLLQEAIDHLSLAHEALGERDRYPDSWDNVSMELAATLLVLGVKRRQFFFSDPSMVVNKLSQVKELSIIKPMEQSLIIYNDLGNARQAAAAHYQLALYFSKVWPLQRDESTTKEKLSNAFRHFISSYRFFRESPGDEPTFVVLCKDMSALYSSLPGIEGEIKALTCLIDTAHAFSSERIIAASERKMKGVGDKLWLNKMSSLSSEIEKCVVEILFNLAKQEQSQDKNGKYKDLYRISLLHQSQQRKGEHLSLQNNESLPAFDLLTKLKRCLGSSINY